MKFSEYDEDLVEWQMSAERNAHAGSKSCKVYEIEGHFIGWGCGLYDPI